MVVRWREANRPPGPRSHRLARWSEAVGGVLQVAGLPEFLANQDELVAETDEDLVELSALADFVVSRNKAGFFSAAEVDPNHFGRRPQEWVAVFHDARLRQPELANAGDRAKAIAVGRFLSGRLGRAVPVQAGELAGLATLRVQPQRSRQRRYWFEVVWGNASPPGPASPPPPAGAVGGAPPAATPPGPASPPPPACGGNDPPPAGGAGGAPPAAPPAAQPGGGNDLEW
jgi:hypothetical protein